MIPENAAAANKNPGSMGGEGEEGFARLKGKPAKARRQVRRLRMGSFRVVQYLNYICTRKTCNTP